MWVILHQLLVAELVPLLRLHLTFHPTKDKEIIVEKLEKLAVKESPLIPLKKSSCFGSYFTHDIFYMKLIIHRIVRTFLQLLLKMSSRDREELIVLD